MFLDDETLVLDPHMDYAVVEGLSNEVRERLGRVRPTSIVRPCPSFCVESYVLTGCRRARQSGWRA